MPNLVGTGLNQVPTNSMLGGMAYQSPDHASIKSLDLKNLSQINSEIADTAVDVFVYDTSKDSDGGAWRKRTQNTSWYNETLNTATRGSRREFPAVAVIVATAASTRRRLIIYDGDDPNLPMWMIVDSADGQWHQTETASPVYALNGIIALGSSSDGQPLYATRNRLDLFNFISDKIEGSTSAAQYEGVIEGIVNRSDVAVVDKMYGSNPYSLVNYRINDVAMTVLPNAPIDPSTGLPIPTIAVATDGGLSIIRDDGTVVDATPTSSGWYPTTVSTYERNKFIMGTSNTAGGYILSVFNSDTTYNITSTPPANGWLHFRSNGANADIYLDLNGASAGSGLPITAVSSMSVGSAKGMNIFDVNDNSHSNSLVAYVTSHYSTGWQHGDIKGAFLSDTDTTNAVGAELVTNGDFSTDSDWSKASHWTISGGSASMPSTGSYKPFFQYNLGMVSGTKYVATVEVTAISGTIKFDTAQSDGGGIASTDGIIITTTGTHALTFVADSSQDGIGAARYEGTTSSCTIDNISVRLAEQDRSVNNKGLAVIGTITKTPVATGAELVAYSGFSGSNYLKQPFNATTMNHGTGDFCYVMWVNINASGTDSQTFVDRSSSNGGVNNPRIRIHKHTNGVFRFYTNGGSVVSTTNLENNGWTQIFCIRRSGSTEVWVNGYLENTGSSSTDFTSTAGQVSIGIDGDLTDPLTAGPIALIRISNSAPSAEQIKKMYEDEKCLFQENAKATLYGSSDAVTALAYDSTTSLLHVGTSGGRSTFSGLKRVENTTTAVATAISASNGLVAEQ